jgi:hypothetical protein
VAARLLCLPATSAHSELVFSVAGVTIAFDTAKSCLGFKKVLKHDTLKDCSSEGEGVGCSSF